MKQRKLGRSGLEVSEISLGCGNLIGVDATDVSTVVRRAIDVGINLIDLVPYHAAEDREAMSSALEGRRHETMLTAHFGAVSSKGEYLKTRDPKLCVPSFEDLLSKLHTDYIDVLMLHWVDTDEDLDLALEKDGYLGAALRLKSDGKARCIAFSTHVVPIAERAIKSGAIGALMFPVNPAHDLLPGDYGLKKMWNETTHDEISRQKTDGGASRAALYHMCETEKIGLIAMKPYAGGLLLDSAPVLDFLTDKPKLRNPGGMVLTPAQCISYVLERPGVSTALVGFRSPEQVDAAVAYFESTAEERDYSSIDVDQMWHLTGRCVYCNHCLPCPEEIQIGRLLHLLDTTEISSSQEIFEEYHQLNRHADDCTECEVCMERCPFGVNVTERMQRAVAVFGRLA